MKTRPLTVIILGLITGLTSFSEASASHPLENRDAGHFMLSQDTALSSAVKVGLKNRRHEKARLTVVFDSSASAKDYVAEYRALQWDVHAMLGSRYSLVSVNSVYFGMSHRLEVDKSFEFRAIPEGSTNYGKGFYGAKVSTYFEEDADQYILIAGAFDDVFKKNMLQDLTYLDKTAAVVILVKTGHQNTKMANQLRVYSQRARATSFISFKEGCDSLLSNLKNLKD